MGPVGAIATRCSVEGTGLLEKEPGMTRSSIYQLHQNKLDLPLSLVENPKKIKSARSDKWKL